jgi:hypothetical protein
VEESTNVLKNNNLKVEFDVFLLFIRHSNNTGVGESNNNNENLVFDINNELKSHSIRTTTWFDKEQQTTTFGGYSNSDDDIPKTRIDQSRKVVNIYYQRLDATNK